MKEFNKSPEQARFHHVESKSHKNPKQQLGWKQKLIKHGMIGTIAFIGAIGANGAPIPEYSGSALSFRDSQSSTLNHLSTGVFPTRTHFSGTDGSLPSPTPSYLNQVVSVSSENVFGQPVGGGSRGDLEKGARQDTAKKIPENTPVMDVEDQVGGGSGGDLEKSARQDIAKEIPKNTPVMDVKDQVGDGSRGDRERNMELGDLKNMSIIEASKEVLKDSDVQKIVGNIAEKIREKDASVMDGLRKLMGNERIKRELLESEAKNITRENITEAVTLLKTGDPVSLMKAIATAQPSASPSVIDQTSHQSSPYIRGAALGGIVAGAILLGVVTPVGIYLYRKCR